ncbi:MULTISPECIES: recombinase family protein [Pseudomonadaceae]|uniref:recombinase family protein n=1 Tax=Pseudomonadaceae TaxID=135621 RepID=UPI00211CF878|nr:MULTISPECIES: recombinase family protein [Pseudomonas]
MADQRDYLFFDKGRSAYKGRHLDDTGELARFLAYVEDGTIPTGSYLVIESLDRLSREKVRDALPRFLDLLAKGINVYTSTDKLLKRVWPVRYFSVQKPENGAHSTPLLAERISVKTCDRALSKTSSHSLSNTTTEPGAQLHGNWREIRGHDGYATRGEKYTPLCALHCHHLVEHWYLRSNDP